MSFGALATFSKPISKKRSMDLSVCLTAGVEMTLEIFCRLVSKTHCCRLNQSKSRVNSDAVPHYACINFRSFSTPYNVCSVRERKNVAFPVKKRNIM